MFNVGVLILLVLLDKSCADDTCWDSDHADAEKGYEYRHYLTDGSYRVDVAVADGEHCRDAPPYARESVFKNIRLSLVLDAVYSQRRGEHKDNDYEDRRKDLIAFIVDYIFDDVERIVLRVYPEQMEYPNHTEHSENNEAREEECGDYRQQVDDAVEGEQKPADCTELVLIGVKEVCSKDAKRILHAEKPDRDILDCFADIVIIGKRGERLHKHCGDICKYDEHQHDVKRHARGIVFFAYLHYFKNTFSQRSRLLFVKLDKNTVYLLFVLHFNGHLKRRAEYTLVVFGYPVQHIHYPAAH